MPKKYWSNNAEANHGLVFSSAVYSYMYMNVYVQIYIYIIA